MVSVRLSAKPLLLALVPVVRPGAARSSGLGRSQTDGGSEVPAGPTGLSLVLSRARGLFQQIGTALREPRPIGVGTSPPGDSVNSHKLGRISKTRIAMALHSTDEGILWSHSANPPAQTELVLITGSRPAIRHT